MVFLALFLGVEQHMLHLVEQNTRIKLLDELEELEERIY